MPLYEYECEETLQVVEIYMSISEALTINIPCPLHTILGISSHKAQKIWSLPSLVSGLSTNTPTVIYRNVNNPHDIRPAVYKGQKTPDGYIKEELKTPMERSRVEREMRDIQNAQNDFDTAKREYVVNHVRKERHSDLNAKMSALTKDAENPEQAKSLLKAAMNRSNKKKVPKKKAEFHFAVNHSDKNNLDKG